MLVVVEMAVVVVWGRLRTISDRRRGSLDAKNVPYESSWSWEKTLDDVMPTRARRTRPTSARFFISSLAFLLP
jgi:hypothetical protein